MKTEKGDFVLLMDPQASKPMLVEITKVKDKQLVGVLSSEDRAQQGDEKFRVSFDQSDVGVNLGASPPRLSRTSIRFSFRCSLCRPR